jgi:CBS-domain-containing membrane protein
MIKAQDIMSRDVVTLPAEMDFAAAARILVENHYNGAPVVDDQGRLLGILCQSDLVAQHKRLPVPTLFTLLDSFVRLTPTKQLEAQVRKIAALTVAQAMTPDPVTVSPETGIETIAGLMVDSNLHTLPVVQEGKLVGVIGKEDVLRTLIKESKGQ